MKKQPVIAVIGAGALGVMFGQRMTQTLGPQRVFFAADAQRAARYAAQSFTCNGAACTFRFVTRQQAQPAALAVFAVKSTGLAAAIETMRPFIGPETLVISLLNGITSEGELAERYGVSREDMDAYALQSQLRAAAAIKEGKFKDEIIPVTVKGRKGDVVVDTDEYPRETSLEKLAALKPSFKEGGNASGMNDASSGVIVMSAEAAEAAGCKPLCRILSVATAGVEPEVMGIGPIPAAQKAMARAGLTMADIDLVEINEAFAAQTLACQRELGIDMDKLNVNGGGISLGHPVGATGSRIIITLMYELKRRGQRYGLATLCAGGGMGTAVIIENMA